MYCISSQAAPPKLLAAVLAEKMSDAQMEELVEERKKKRVLVYKMIPMTDTDKDVVSYLNGEG